MYREMIVDLLSRDRGSLERPPLTQHAPSTADATRSNTASEESSIATVLTVTRNTAPGCPGQHRHFGELVKGLKSRRKTNVGNGIRPPATTADGRPTKTIPSTK